MKKWTCFDCVPAVPLPHWWGEDSGEVGEQRGEVGYRFHFTYSPRPPLYLHTALDRSRGLEFQLCRVREKYIKETLQRGTWGFLTALCEGDDANTLSALGPRKQNFHGGVDTVNNAGRTETQ